MTKFKVPTDSTLTPSSLPSPPLSSPVALELMGICKYFGTVSANHQVNMRVKRGTVHGIIGENGAGKSTLMNILYGFYQADAGSIYLDGQPVRIRSSQDAIRLKMGMVHQHFMLVDTFTVLENIVLGAEHALRLGYSFNAARTHLLALERDYALNVDPDALVGQLDIGSQQRVEILKALYRGAEILILDEPTAVLTPNETEQLFRIVRQLKAQGKTILLITHKLHEVFDVTDYVTVMRNGQVVANVATAAVNSADLANFMVGRPVHFQLKKITQAPGRVVLSVKNLALTDKQGVERLKEINFEVRAGEIVGIAGIAGNGQTELVKILAGLLEPSSGAIHYKGHNLTELKLGRTKAARLREMGVAHIPEDRLKEGLIKSFSIYENVILGYQKDSRVFKGPLYNRKALLERSLSFARLFNIQPMDPFLRCGLLSGGNQQKIVLAREIFANPDLLLVGQPTRGVDIGAIEFIHQRLLELRAAGKAILLISVELEELLRLSDRILVMEGGRITGQLTGQEMSLTQLGLLMGGDLQKTEGKRQKVEQYA